MKFSEAMKIYELGGSVRCKNWPLGQFMSIIRDNTSSDERISLWHYLSEEWETLDDHIKTDKSEIGTVGDFRFMRSNGKIAHVKSGQKMSDDEFVM